MNKLTTRPILPDLVSVVKEFGTVHYQQATQVLLDRGVWGTEIPSTPAMTVNNYLTTSRDENGNPMFERIDAGTYQLAGTHTTILDRIISFFKNLL